MTCYQSDVEHVLFSLSYQQSDRKTTDTDNQEKAEYRPDNQPGQIVSLPLIVRYC